MVNIPFCILMVHTVKSVSCLWFSKKFFFFCGGKHDEEPCLFLQFPLARYAVSRLNGSRSRYPGMMVLTDSRPYRALSIALTVLKAARGTRDKTRSLLRLGTDRTVSYPLLAVHKTAPTVAGDHLVIPDAQSVCCDCSVPITGLR